MAALIDDQVLETHETYTLDYLNVTTGNKTIATATVRLKTGNEIKQDASTVMVPLMPL
ncbi:MAG: hypothetical protein R3F23_01730 [Verrucomicrobiia bacterium]